METHQKTDSWIDLPARTGDNLINGISGFETFHIPPELEAHEPPEARGLSRDQVRLMVSFGSSHRVIHSQFQKLPDFLSKGDVLVINTSRTINAAVMARREDGSSAEVHFSSHLPSNRWVVELRQPVGSGSEPIFSANSGEMLVLPGDARLILKSPHNAIPSSDPRKIQNKVRLWDADFQTPGPVESYLAANGFPIQYKHVWRKWPLPYYQTVYADEAGSAEMPSAGRPFTHSILDRLREKGIQIAPLLLHTGVASVETNERPPEEYYRVSQETAEAVNCAHGNGCQVIAVGTTAVRALETVTSVGGRIHSGEGWTTLMITPQRKISSVDGLLTGLHEPRSTHLLMLCSLAGVEHLQRSYAEALKKRYLWHEFGDVHLILP